MRDEFCWDDGYTQSWEPDEWDTINQNEADDYRHELDDDGEYEDPMGNPPPDYPDVCPDCHEPADCCACEHDTLVGEIKDALELAHGYGYKMLEGSAYVGATFTAEFGLVIDLTLANGKTYRIKVEEFIERKPVEEEGA